MFTKEELELMSGVSTCQPNAIVGHNLDPRGNDLTAEPFEPRPTYELWDPEDMVRNREGTVVRTGLYLHDRKRLRTSLTELETEITEETAARKKADAEIGDRLTIIEEEVIDAGGWQTALAAEAHVRSETDNSLRSDLTDETNLRSAFDKKLDTDLKAEKTARIAGDTDLQTQINGLGTAARRNIGLTATEVPEILANGKLSPSIIPAMPINNTHTVASEAEMLAITGAGVGDLAIRTDTKESFILTALPANVLANWMPLTSHQDTVTPIELGGTGRTDGLAQGVVPREVTDGTDLNTLITSAVYGAGRPTGLTNAPTGAAGTFFILESESINEYNGKQTYFDTNTGQMWIRNREGKTWHDWVEVTNPTPDKLKTARHLQVNLASQSSSLFDGSADASGIGVKGILQTINGGTGNNRGGASSVGGHTQITDFASITIPLTKVLQNLGEYPFNADNAKNGPEGAGDTIRGSMILYPGNNEVLISAVGPHGSYRGVGDGTYAAGSTNGVWTVTGLRWLRTVDSEVQGIETNTDLDTVTISGWYGNGGKTGITNFPAGENGTYFTLQVQEIAPKSGNGVQIYTDTNNNHRYHRVWNLNGAPGTGYSFTPWKELFGDTDVIPIANGGTGRTDGKVTQVALQVSPGDIDTLYATGSYQINGSKPTGYPTDETQGYGVLTVQNSGNADSADDFAFQTLTSVDGNVWLRTRSGSPASWHAWQKLNGDTATVTTLKQDVANLRAFVSQLVRNLNDSGAYSVTDSTAFPTTGAGTLGTFNGHIAYGNINVYGSNQDGNQAIYTAKVSPESSIAVGV